MSACCAQTSVPLCLASTPLPEAHNLHGRAAHDARTCRTQTHTWLVLHMTYT